mgnify:FL=1
MRVQLWLSYIYVLLLCCTTTSTNSHAPITTNVFSPIFPNSFFNVQAAPRKAQEALFDEVVRCGLSLMQDQYGNYVVQYTIDRAGSEFLAKLTKSVAGYVASLSRQKFSSNVSVLVV